MRPASAGMDGLNIGHFSLGPLLMPGLSRPYWSVAAGIETQILDGSD
jgi:hypothetical protein